MKRRAEIAAYIICTAVLIWVLTSWINVIVHNGNPSYEYPWWNIFTWIAKGGN